MFDLVALNRKNTQIYGVGMALYAVERSKDMPFVKWEAARQVTRDSYLFKARLLVQTLEGIGLRVVDDDPQDAA